MTDNPEQTPTDDFPGAEKIVDAFGGVRPMATRLGVAATTIQGWKSRGNIPDARRAEVRDAARAAGIDLDDIASVAAADKEVPAEEVDNVTNAAVAPAKQPTQGVAWLALALAIAAGVAVATQPLWNSTPTVDTSGLADAVARIEKLEAAPVPNLDPLVARLAALDAAQSSLQADAARRKADPQAVAPDLTPRLDALAARQAQNRGALDTISQRLGALSTAMQAVGKTEDADRKVALESIRAELATLRARLDDGTVRDGSVNAVAASLVLAVASLEDAVASGAPFTAPLSVIERFAENDAALAELVSPLIPHAVDGIPTQARLAREFSEIAAQLSAPLWSDTGFAWIDKVLGKVDALVTIRRLEDSEGKASPVVRAERALAANDLPGAIAALAGLSGPGANWAKRAKARVAADQAMAGLRLRAIEMLGAAK